VGLDEVVFEGEAQVNARFGGPGGTIPTGGKAGFVLTMRRVGEQWLADDLEFRDRGWSVGPAELPGHLLNDVVCHTLGIERLPFDGESLPAVEKKLGLQSWVFYHTGGPVRFRLTADEGGEDQPRELLATTFDVRRVGGPGMRAGGAGAGREDRRANRRRAGAVEPGPLG